MDLLGQDCMLQLYYGLDAKRLTQAVREAATICPRPLQVDL